MGALPDSPEGKSFPVDRQIKIGEFDVIGGRAADGAERSVGGDGEILRDVYRRRRAVDAEVDRFSSEAAAAIVSFEG